MLYNNFQYARTPLKVSLLVEASISLCNTCSLDPPDAAFQTASRSVQPF